MTARTGETPTPSIDKDIMEKADDVYEDAIARFGILVSKSSRAALVVVISRALQEARNEERDRCAKIIQARLPLYADIAAINAVRECLNSVRQPTAIRKGD